MQNKHYPETRFAAWKRVHRLTLKVIAGALGVSIQQVSRYLLHPDHSDHNQPGRDVSDRLRKWTGDAFHAGNTGDVYEPGEELPPAPSNEGAQRADAVPHDIQ